MEPRGQWTEKVWEPLLYMHLEVSTAGFQLEEKGSRLL
jgi:hypothetical protein